MSRRSSRATGVQTAPIDRSGPAAARWARVCDVVAGHLGLALSNRPAGDAQSRLADAAAELRFPTVEACIDWLLSATPDPAQLEVLASHLTVGETYFLRDPQAFEALAGHVLPRLVRQKRGRDQRLRLWSAGCASGEEPYSLAILLEQQLPDLANWHVTILGTDINTTLLRRAAAAVYGEWSFRGVPPALKARYFRRLADGRYALRDDIRRLVTFDRLNLATGAYPSLLTNTNAMDIILCRNVLMYFTPAQRRQVVHQLHAALVDEGWLVVSPAETSSELFAEFTAVTAPGATLYQKRDVTRREAPLPVVADQGEIVTERLDPDADRAQGEAVSRREREPDELSSRVRALANAGRLAEALDGCEQWTEAHKLDASAHYVHALVLAECGRIDEARRALLRAVYLDGDFVLAHFALATLARRTGRDAEAKRHFANTQRILARLRADEVLPESDGLTAGRLAETVASVTGTDRTND